MRSTPIDRVVRGQRSRRLCSRFSATKKHRPLLGLTADGPGRKKRQWSLARFGRVDLYLRTRSYSATDRIDIKSLAERQVRDYSQSTLVHATGVIDGDEQTMPSKPEAYQWTTLTQNSRSTKKEGVLTHSLYLLETLPTLS